MDTVRSLIEAFANRLSAIVEQQTIVRARMSIETALGGGRRPGRPSKMALAPLNGRARRKGPKQLCPVPGCKNAAAPVFGMVCAQHKDMPKTQIKKYREQRRAKKEKAAKQAA